MRRSEAVRPRVVPFDLTVTERSIRSIGRPEYRCDPVGKPVRNKGAQIRPEL